MPAQFTLPPDNRSVGSGNPPADMNAVVDALTAQGAVYNVLNAAYSGGADPTGVSDSAAAWQAAINAVPAGGGAVIVPPGTYKIASTVTSTAPGVYIVCPGGKGSAVVNFTGTGDCLRMYSATNYTPPSGVLGGGILGLLIDGTGAGAGSAALHIGDLYQLELNVAVRNFTGAASKGVWLDNNYHWTEQLTGKIWAEQCTTCVVFDNSANTSGVATGSFDRAVLDIFLDCKDKGNGVTFQAGALMVNSWLGIWGNINSSASGPFSVLTITGSTGGSFSRIAGSVLNVGVELNTNNLVLPKTITFGTAGLFSNSIQNCTGLLDFSGNLAMAAAVNATGGFQFSGTVYGDGVLAKANATPPPPPLLALAPSGATGQTFDRGMCASYTTALVSGQSYVSAIPLPGGLPITNLGVLVGSTGFATVTHGWLALLDSARVVLAVTADQTSSFGSVSTALPLPIAGSYTTAYSGLYYLAVCVVAGTMGVLSIANQPLNVANTTPPILAGTSTGSLTTPPAVSSTMGAITSNGIWRFYGYTS